MYPKMPTKPKICIFFQFGLPTIRLTLCSVGNFACCFDVCWIFLDNINFFENFLQSQTVWIKIRPDIVSGLIWVQTVCKCYQQTTLVRKELIKFRIKWIVLVWIDTETSNLYHIARSLVKSNFMIFISISIFYYTLQAFDQLFVCWCRLRDFFSVFSGNWPLPNGI